MTTLLSARAIASATPPSQVSRSQSKHARCGTRLVAPEQPIGLWSFGWESFSPFGRLTKQDESKTSTRLYMQSATLRGRACQLIRQFHRVPRSRRKNRWQRQPRTQRGDKSKERQYCVEKTWPENAGAEQT